MKVAIDSIVVDFDEKILMNLVRAIFKVGVVRKNTIVLLDLNHVYLKTKTFNNDFLQVDNWGENVNVVFVDRILKLVKKNDLENIEIV